MNNLNLAELVQTLRAQCEIIISYKFHFIKVFKNSNGELQGNIYDGEKFIFGNEEILETDTCIYGTTEKEAIQFFIEIVNNY